MKTLTMREEVKPGWFAVNGAFAGYDIETAAAEIKSILPALIERGGDRYIEYIHPIFEDREILRVGSFERGTVLNVYADPMEWSAAEKKIPLIKILRITRLNMNIMDAKDEVESGRPVFLGTMTAEVAWMLESSMTSGGFMPTLYGTTS